MQQLKKFKLHICILIYLILISLILLSNPKYAFNEDGTLKQFGTGNEKTVLPLWLIIILLALIAYYIANIFVIFK